MTNATASLSIDAIESYRPSLVRLTKDVEDLRTGSVGSNTRYSGSLHDGFETRADVLWWLQALSVRTLGQVEQEFYVRMGRQFKTKAPDDERTLLACLLVEPNRTKEVDPVTAKQTRLRTAADVVLPAFHRAFRHLRKSATEYTGEPGKDEKERPDSLKQRYIAMRPAIDEINEWQTRTLDAILDGLSDREAIIEWCQWLELATHGETEDGFTSRCYRENETANLLTSSDDAHQWAREAFAAQAILPMFNLGVRDLSGKAGEFPDEKPEPRGPGAVA